MPKTEVIDIIENDPELRKTDEIEIINILNAVRDQNYFQINQQYYKQRKGLALDACISAILAEVYIQYKMRKQLYPILIKYQIISYFRYVNGILIIYNQNKCR
jgi:hypothetical protein